MARIRSRSLVLVVAFVGAVGVFLLSGVAARGSQRHVQASWAVTLHGPNKDDTQFGVRAVDSSGNRSPISFAVPTVS